MKYSENNNISQVMRHFKIEKQIIKKIIDGTAASC